MPPPSVNFTGLAIPCATVKPCASLACTSLCRLCDLIPAPVRYPLRRNSVHRGFDGKTPQFFDVREIIMQKLPGELLLRGKADLELAGTTDNNQDGPQGALWSHNRVGIDNLAGERSLEAC